MLGIEDQRPAVLENHIEPVRVTGNLAVMSMAFLLPDTSFTGYLARADEDDSDPAVP